MPRLEDLFEAELDRWKRDMHRRDIAISQHSVQRQRRKLHSLTEQHGDQLIGDLVNAQILAALAWLDDQFGDGSARQYLKTVYPKMPEDRDD
jgi:hypothetical protein